MSDMITIEEKITVLNERHDKLTKQLEDVEQDLNALRRTLNILAPKTGRKKGADSFLTKVSDIHGMALDKAVTHIAKQHDGEINTYHARAVLVDAGILKGETQSASRKLYNFLIASKNFERGGQKGKWILIEKSPVSDLESILG